MYLMYVDESGDGGVYQDGKNSKHFILSGIVINYRDWKDIFTKLKQFRLAIREKFGLSIREEIHAGELIRISKTEAYRSIRKSDRIKILRLVADNLPTIAPSVKIINICIDKTKVELGSFNNYNDYAWSRLIQRYDRFLKSKNDLGIVIADDTDETMVRNLMRKMRVYNPVTSHYGGTYQAITDSIIEDPFMRDSKHSYLVQMADVVSHLLYRKEYPKGSLKKFGLHLYFDSLEPILLKEASRSDILGVVRK